MTVVAVVLVLAGALFIGAGQRRAATRTAPQVLGAGVVMFFGGVALVPFRTGDRAPVAIVGAIALLVGIFAASAIKGRR